MKVDWRVKPFLLGGQVVGVVQVGFDPDPRLDQLPAAALAGVVDKATVNPRYG